MARAASASRVYSTSSEAPPPLSCMAASMTSRASSPRKRFPNDPPASSPSLRSASARMVSRSARTDIRARRALFHIASSLGKSDVLAPSPFSESPLSAWYSSVMR